MSTNWSEKQAAEAIKKAKAHWGVAGWNNLSDDMRQAYICREIVAVLVGQDEDSASPAMLRMMKFAELALSDSK